MSDARQPPVAPATMIAPSPPAPPIVITDEPASALRYLASKDTLSWLLSLCINTALLLILACIALPMLADKPERVITILPFGELAEDDAAFDIQPTDTADGTHAQATLEKIGLTRPEIELTPEHQVDAVEAPSAAIQPLSVAGNRPVLPAGAVLNRPLSVGRPTKPLTDRELGQAESIDSAVDRVGKQVHEMLDQGDLLVVWMMDASISLVDDRQRVAARLAHVYAEIEAQRRAQALEAKETKVPLPIFRNAVIAFGGGVREILPPTPKLDRVVRGILSVPIDETGEEHTFKATQVAVAKYAKSWKRQILVVIWTDESADDILLLEPTIALCKEYNARVNVIGPTAVFGAEMGTHAYYPTPQSFAPYWLPVKKGPDTAFAERLLWPYWYHAFGLGGAFGGQQLPAWHDPAYPADPLGGWYGGPEMYHISSGLPPYALTRLTRETGGSYTIFDRAQDRGPFTVEKMRPYTADYRSAAEIFEDLQYAPLRQAVLASVEVTRTPLVWPDRLRNPSEFRIALEGGPVFLPVLFGNPAQIRNNLKVAALNSARSLAKIELALKPFGPSGMELAYEQEQSSRWKASYDLTCGRLLAQYVRHSELLAGCQLALKANIPDEANCLSGIEPVARIISGDVTLQRAAEAERLLRRCVDDNRSTPWAYLAERELLHPLGCQFRIFYIEPPPPPPIVDLPPPVDLPTPSGPAPSIPRL
jgi:hypothetical protein